MSQYIDNPEKLQQLCKKLQSHDWIALDTEFIRERNYYPILCLIQVAAGDTLACIDPLAIDDLSPFLDILNDPHITKVFHAAYQDLEIFYYLMEAVPSPIFDTQPAASVLGLGEQIGYARLVENLLGVSLEKSQSRTDWSRRPLSQQQIDYAIDDVRYLQKIYPLMLQQLDEKERLNWLDHDFKHLSQQSTYAVDLMHCWKRVKGKQYLKGQKLAVLQQLAAWREQVAMQKDKPRRWIVSDDILIDLARRSPHTIEQIHDLRGIKEGHIKHYHTAWFQRIKTAQQCPKEQWPSLPNQHKASIEQELLIDLLMMIVRYQAQQHQISPAAIASRKDIASMIIAGQSQFSNDWRGRLLNDLFNNILNNQTPISVQSGQLHIGSADGIS